MAERAERAVTKPTSGPSPTAWSARAEDRKRCQCAGTSRGGCIACGSGVVRRKASAGTSSPGATPSGHSFGSVPLFAPETIAVSTPDDASEVAADRAAAAALRRLDGADETEEAPALEATAPMVQRAAQESAHGQPGAGGLIVDDEARTLSSGQMRKSELLALLRVEACNAADRALAESGRNTQGCPSVERWLDHYAARPAEHLERALRKYAPETAGARSARDYVTPVSARIGNGARVWARTGRLPDDTPAEVREAALGGGVLGAIGGALGGVVGAIGGLVSGVGKAVGGLFFKPGDAAPAAGVDAGALSAQLGPGRPIDPAARSRMEMAFGADFAGVRVHSDDGAARLSSDLRARAFTLGEHVAFGAGEYRPGTMTGDALLAHELAHVVQQQGGAAPEARGAVAAEPAPALEHEADEAAAGALEQIYLKPQPVTRRARRATRGRGLRLQRCASGPKAAATGMEGAKVMSPAELVALAANDKISIDQRGIQLVQAILATFYPTEASKFKEVTWAKNIDGLMTQCPPDSDANVSCTLEVGEDFVKSTDERQLSRRVMQVGHELKHVDQHRQGMGGSKNRAEREFLAFHWEATAPIPAGLKRMQHTTRVNVIDGAIRAFNCFDADLKAKYQAKFDELVKLRETEVQKGGKDKGPVPTDCKLD